MNKCHTNINWVNDTTPAINDTNLNYMDGCIDTIDDRVISLDTTKAAQSDLLLAFKDVALNSSTGVITFTLFNNTTKTIDTLLEKIAINFDYDDDPTSPHYQNLIIELEDGTYKYIDMSALITEYEFDDTSTIAFTVANDGSVTADIIDGSITGTKLQPDYLADCVSAKTNAESAATSSNTNKLVAEGWAVGEQGGVPVTSGSPYYHNNAKYYKDQAQAIASQSLSGLSDVAISNPQDGQALVYDAANSEWTNKAISRIIAIPVPTSQTYTYTGSAQTFAWDSIDTDSITVTGDTQTNAGTYTVTATLNMPNDVWTDNTTSPKTFTWVIGKANASITLSPNNLSLSNATSSASVTVTFTNDTGVGITSNDTDVAASSVASLNASGSITVTTTKGGSATITVTTTASSNYNTATATLSVTSTFATLKTFATATDAEIAEMVALADAGTIDLYTDAGWRVGQERQVSLSAIAATGTYDGVSWSVGEAQSAQTATLVLLYGDSGDTGLPELVTPVVDPGGITRNTCHFVVGIKNCLETAGYLNATRIYNSTWRDLARRNWCNGGFRSALPSAIRGAFKQFKCITAEDNDSTINVTTQDYFALCAEKEIWGSQVMSNPVEANALTAFSYYSAMALKVKTLGDNGSATRYWDRSPYNPNNFGYCNIEANGYRSGTDDITTAMGISPFGVV